MAKKPEKGAAPPEPPKERKRGGGRPSKLNPDVTKKIVDALIAGNFFSTACELAGISEATGREWLARGNGTTSKRKPAPEFAEFAEAIKNAEAQAEANSVLRIRKAGKGGDLVRSKVTTKYNADGSIKEVVEEKEVTAPNWTADAWFLERKFASRWGRRESMKPSSGEAQDNRPVINITPPQGRTL